MRTLIITLLFLPMLALANPASQVFMHECKETNKLNVGFKCEGIDAAGQLQLRKTKNDFTGSEKEKSDYHFNKLILRFIELGGTYIDVTADFWPKNALRSCQATSTRTNYTCYDCMMVEKDGVSSCDPVN